MTVQIPLRNRTAEANLAGARIQSQQLLTTIRSQEQAIKVDVRNAAQTVDIARRQVSSARAAREDKAKGVAPAEFIVSFEHARRKAIVTAAGVPAAFQAAFPNGAEVSSSSDGYSIELQLPTRAVTLAGKYYNGSDLRFFLGGQLLSNFNDTAGLMATASTPSIDGASTVIFGLRDGIASVAPQRPVRGQGGFLQLGFPLSRIFVANPEGRNAGWTAYLYYGFDEALSRDARRFSPVRGRSDLFSGNIQYKLNSFVTFGYEQGYYRTRAANTSVLDFGSLPLFRGIPSYTSHNLRSEFASIFTF